MRVLTTYDAIDRAQWEALVRESRTGTWFQSPEAYAFFASQTDVMEPFVIGVEDDARLRAVCVGYVTREQSRWRQFFTRRAIITGGVCVAENATNAEIRVLLSALRKHTEPKCIYIEMRNFEDYSPWKKAFEAAGFVYQPHLNFHVDPMNTILSENRRRQIHKGERIAVVGEGVREEEIREWYQILKRLYRTKVKTPLWPESFFIEAFRQRVAKFMLVKHAGKVIGGSMIVATDRCVYEWFECGMNAEYKEQYPSVMATWAGIQWAKAHGATRYDMMGAGEPGVPYGVRDFKAEFGGRLVEHGRCVYVAKPGLYRLGKWAVKWLKRK